MRRNRRFASTTGPRPLAARPFALLLSVAVVLAATHSPTAALDGDDHAAPSAQQQAGTVPPPVLSREWKQLQTPNLTVVGNAADGELRKVAREMERFKGALRALRPTLRLEGSVPTLVVVFRDDRTLTPFKPRYRGKPLEGVAAYFSPLGHVSYIVLAPSQIREFTYQVIFHEYTHFVINRNMGRVPLWLHEGLADFFSTFSGSETDARTVLGRPLARYIGPLRERTPIPLRRLLAPDSATELFRDPIATHMFYAQSWAFVHYLMVGAADTRRGQLGTYLGALRSGAQVDAAFKQAFSVEFEAMDAELRQYVARFSFPALQVTTAAIPDADLRIERVPEVRALQIQADLLVHTGVFALADDYLSKASALESADVPTRLTRMRSLLGQRRVDDAAALAAADDLAGVPDFGAQLTRANVLRAAERYDAAIAAYQRAIAIQPDAPAAHFGLSLAQLVSDPQAAMASFSRCMSLDPNPEWYRSRQFEALRMGQDAFAATDAYNYLRQTAWQTEGSVYVALGGVLTHLRRNKPADAAALLTEAAQHTKPESWQASLVAYFQDQVTPDQLLARAKTIEMQTEAHAYIGIRASIDGRRDEARRHLEWVRERGRKDFIEYDYALAELKRLDAAQ